MSTFKLLFNCPKVPKRTLAGGLFVFSAVRKSCPSARANAGAPFQSRNSVRLLVFCPAGLKNVKANQLHPRMPVSKWLMHRSMNIVQWSSLGHRLYPCIIYASHLVNGSSHLHQTSKPLSENCGTLWHSIPTLSQMYVSYIDIYRLPAAWIGKGRTRSDCVRDWVFPRSPGPSSETWRSRAWWFMDPLHS